MDGYNELRDDIAEIKGMVGQIDKTLRGNGGPGLCTKVAICEKQIKDLPSPSALKWYATIGGGIAMTVAIGAFTILRVLGLC